MKVRYTFDIEITVPMHWTAEDIEFSKNESSWCADNAIGDLERYAGHPGTGCLCGSFSCKYLEDTDVRPRRTITIIKEGEGGE